MMTARQTILIFCIILTGTTGLLADQVWLRNGKKYEGTIVNQSRFQIRIRTAEGDKTVAKSAVRRITFGGAPKPAKPEKKPEPATPAAAKPAAPEAPSARRVPTLPARSGQRPAPRAVPTLPAGSGPRAATKAGPAASVATTASLEDILKKKAAAAARKKAEEERKRKEAERKAAEERKRRAEIARRRKQERADALGRSLIFPGWGQRSIQKRERVGYAFSGAFALTLGQAVFLEFEAARLASVYSAQEQQWILFLAASPSSSGGALDYVLSNRLYQSSRAFNQARVSQFQFLLLAGAIYAANIGDVVLAKPAGAGSSLILGPSKDPGAVGFSLAFEFGF